MTQTTPTIELPNKAYLLPDAVAMWPPVWWTWPILATVIISMTLMIWWWLKRFQKRAYRREALTLLKEKLPQSSSKDAIILCHELIRRCLISAGQEQIAALSSRDLIAHLDENMPAKYQFAKLGDAFVMAPYQAQITLEIEQLNTMIATTRYWIRRHHA